MIDKSPRDPHENIANPSVISCLREIGIFQHTLHTTSGYSSFFDEFHILDPVSDDSYRLGFKSSIQKREKSHPNALLIRTCVYRPLALRVTHNFPSEDRLFVFDCRIFACFSSSTVYYLGYIMYVFYDCIIILFSFYLIIFCLLFFCCRRHHAKRL